MFPVPFSFSLMSYCFGPLSLSLPWKNPSLFLFPFFFSFLSQTSFDNLIYNGANTMQCPGEGAVVMDDGEGRNENLFSVPKKCTDFWGSSMYKHSLIIQVAQIGAFGHAEVQKISPKSPDLGIQTSINSSSATYQLGDLR